MQKSTLASDSKTSKLDILKEKKKDLESKIASEEAKLKKTTRTLDTRQKVLLGAFLKKHLSDTTGDPNNTLINTDEFINTFKKFIIRKNDQKIFNFDNTNSFLESLL